MQSKFKVEVLCMHEAHTKNKILISDYERDLNVKIARVSDDVNGLWQEMNQKTGVVDTELIETRLNTAFKGIRGAEEQLNS